MLGEAMFVCPYVYNFDIYSQLDLLFCKNQMVKIIIRDFSNIVLQFNRIAIQRAK
jgi:hypothetical protein